MSGEAAPPPRWLIAWLAVLTGGLAYALLREPAAAPAAAPLASAAALEAPGARDSAPPAAQAATPNAASKGPRKSAAPPAGAQHSVPLGSQWRTAVGRDAIVACWAVPAAANLPAALRLRVTVDESGALLMGSATDESLDVTALNAFTECLERAPLRDGTKLAPGEGNLTLLRTAG